MQQTWEAGGALIHSFTGLGRLCCRAGRAEILVDSSRRRRAVTADKRGHTTARCTDCCLQHMSTTACHVYCTALHCSPVSHEPVGDRTLAKTTLSSHRYCFRNLNRGTNPSPHHSFFPISKLISFSNPTLHRHPAPLSDWFHEYLDWLTYGFFFSRFRFFLVSVVVTSFVFSFSDLSLISLS